MSVRIAAFIRQNVTGLIAIFIALGGTAYANNEWTGANIVDGSLTTFDYKNNDIRSADVHDTTLKAADLAPDAIYDDKLIPTQGSTRIAPNAIQESELSDSSVFSPEVANNSLTGADVKDNSLTGSDINESTLNAFSLAGPVSYTFADNDTGQICNGYCTEGSLKFIPPGTYLLMGKIQATQEDLSADSTLVDCEMVAGSDPATHDLDFAGYGDLNGDFLGATLPMQVVHTFDTTDNASIQCRDYDDGSSFGSDLKITAIKLGAVNGRATG
jgi:hypothetical protein